MKSWQSQKRKVVNIKREIRGSETINTSAALKELRSACGVSLRNLAEDTGVSVSAMSRWERGKRVPDVERFEKVLNALGAELIVAMRK